jgi:hypothetical protein
LPGRSSLARCRQKSEVTHLVIAAMDAHAMTDGDPNSSWTERRIAAVTADQQKGNISDRELTAKIRRSIMADKSLSSYAHNIKIVSQNGTVTLKGPVKSDDEKKVVMAKAVEVAGSANNVTDQMNAETIIAAGSTPQPEGARTQNSSERDALQPFPLVLHGHTSRVY